MHDDTRCTFSHAAVNAIECSFGRLYLCAFLESKTGHEGTTHVDRAKKTERISSYKLDDDRVDCAVLLPFQRFDLVVVET